MAITIPIIVKVIVKPIKCASLGAKMSVYNEN